MCQTTAVVLSFVLMFQCVSCMTTGIAPVTNSTAQSTGAVTTMQSTAGITSMLPASTPAPTPSGNATTTPGNSAYQITCGNRTVYVAEPTQSTHSNKKEIDVPSFVQKYSWDCGLACVCMVLRHLGIDDSKIYKEDHTDLDCGDSVWTIDLAFLLQKYGIKNRLTTTTLGVDKGYGTSEAESKGIVVEKGSVPVDEILNHLEGDNLVIALVDWSYLECIWCDKLVSIYMCSG
ncbi:unnamed protein product [Mytilus edulis]|uniref:Guanylyl cyclase n=1 Tax=Mytilus edulis TaxID=6550 RepID=A0A8S3UGH7_MYTED|nr:unnamed protein product [Mytilus edulis]